MPFNQTNVELKRVKRLFIDTYNLAFNQTNVELKHSNATISVSTAKTFNQTNVELKPSSVVSLSVVALLLIRPTWN